MTLICQYLRKTAIIWHTLYIKWTKEVLVMDTNCTVYAKFVPLYAELHLCPCSCPLHPLPKAWSNCYGRQVEREKKQRSRELYPWRTQDKSPVRRCFVGSCDYDRTLHFQRSEWEVLSFHRAGLMGLWVSSRNAYIIIPAFQTQTGRAGGLIELLWTSGFVNV